MKSGRPCAAGLVADAALVAAANLTHRYISDRQLPDKAIDAMDEAMAGLRLELDSMPAELDALERRIRQLQIERAGLEAEGGSDAAAKTSRLDEQIAQAISGWRPTIWRPWPIRPTRSWRRATGSRLSST